MIVLLLILILIAIVVVVLGNRRPRQPDDDASIAKRLKNKQIIFASVVTCGLAFSVYVDGLANLLNTLGGNKIMIILLLIAILMAMVSSGGDARQSRKNQAWRRNRDWQEEIRKGY